MRFSTAVLALTLGAHVGCGKDGGDVATDPDAAAVDSPSPADADSSTLGELLVTVTIDGKPSPNTLVLQGGNPARWRTNAEGKARILIDATVVGDLFVMASHEEARIEGDFVPKGDSITIALKRFDVRDNEAYQFLDPGEPTRRESTAQCGHCHRSINDDWFASPHRTAAKNPVVHDLYAGAAATFESKTLCESAGGRWWSGLGPGTGSPATRCYLGDGVLPTLNPTCGKTSPCDGVATKFGACADCHAPGIDGKLGGRDLLEAKGFAYDFGIHCDVCHRTESIDLTKDAGTAGRLRLLRPSEKSPSVTLGEWYPLTFGPSPDVPNPKMGSVKREHFMGATICAGCHEHEQPVLVPGATLIATRWPSGKLPIHTTFGEWKASAMSPGVPCQGCHMPPNPGVWNGSDLQMFASAGAGIAGGWVRPPGSVRHHSWIGPRQPESGMLELSAAVFIEKKVVSGTLIANITVRNVGPGHAMPTGEPLRSMLMLVDATCGGVSLEPTGGAVVPDFGGFLDRHAAGEDWSTWPGARVGEVVRVVRRTGSYYDYKGFGPFGDGTFAASAKGMPVEEIVGSSIVTAVSGSAVTFDKPLPSGDVAYRVEPSVLPTKGAIAASRAGAPGFGFARVLVGADGRRMVPHFLAVDVASDNRLMPQSEWSSEHRFKPTCGDPVVRAVLVHRAYPLWLARERGWTVRDSVMLETSR